MPRSRIAMVTLNRLPYHLRLHSDFTAPAVTTFLSILFGMLITAVCWIDHGNSDGIGQYWWAGLVAAYLLVCLDVTLRNVPRVLALSLITIAGVIVVLSVIAFESLLTLYIAAATLLGISIAGWYYESGIGNKLSRVAIGMIGVLIIALAMLPLEINRVEVRLPNLSAGTYLSVVDAAGNKASLSHGFFNRSDDHLELTVHLGAQFFPGEGRPNPRLRIDIVREKIVVRLLSIRFQTQIGYLDKTLLEINGPTLDELIALNADSAAKLEMEGERLLISQLRVGEPLILSLPRIDTVSFSTSERVLSIVLRLLLLGLLVYAMVTWAPVRKSVDPMAST